MVSFWETVWLVAVWIFWIAIFLVAASVVFAAFVADVPTWARVAMVIVGLAGSILLIAWFLLRW